MCLHGRFSKSFRVGFCFYFIFLCVFWFVFPLSGRPRHNNAIKQGRFYVPCEGIDSLEPKVNQIHDMALMEDKHPHVHLKWIT